LALYIQMSYMCGQRPWKDLRNLKWSNIKLDKKGYYLDFIISKTNTHLMLPLSKETMNLLNSLTKASEYIFVTENGEHLCQAAISSQFKKVKKYALLDNNLMIRDLRRTAITEMAMAGATTQEIEATTGWRCSNAVLKRYAVLRKETANNCLDKRLEFQKNNYAVSTNVEILPEAKSQT